MQKSSLDQTQGPSTALRLAALGVVPLGMTDFRGFNYLGGWMPFSGWDCGVLVGDGVVFGVVLGVALGAVVGAVEFELDGAVVVGGAD